MKTLFLLTLLAVPASAQESFALVWSTVSGGGSGASPEPGEFTLAGSSLGQFAAGETSGKPGEFTVSAGYWTFPLEPPDLHLTMSLDGSTVTLTWDAGGPDVILESSGDLQLWEPVDPQPATPFFQEPEGSRKYYRLVPP